MAPRDAATGNKRKLSEKTKDKSTKKPKFEKRPPPPKEEPEDVSDDSAFGDFSDDQEDGGASLSNGKPEKASKQSNGNANGDADSGKTFERGLFSVHVTMSFLPV